VAARRRVLREADQHRPAHCQVGLVEAAVVAGLYRDRGQGDLVRLVGPLAAEVVESYRRDRDNPRVEVIPTSRASVPID
jgi:hypothetical protein